MFHLKKIARIELIVPDYYTVVGGNATASLPVNPEYMVE